MEIESPSTPALDAARAEMTDIATNPQNPRHAAYHRGDSAVSAYIDGLYKHAVPKHATVPLATESVSLGPVDPQEGETPEEAEVRQRNDVILAPLKQEWGPDYETRFAQARATASTLFADCPEVLDELGTIVRMQYGPKGEAAALKFFAELEAIKHGRLTMDTNTILENVEQRGVAARAQRLATETQEVEAARDKIGRQHYEGAKARLPIIEQAISQRFRPALNRVSALARANAPTRLPTGIEQRRGELAQLCDTVPQQIRAGLNGYEGLVYPHLVNPAVPKEAIIAGTKTLLQGSDGMLTYMDKLLANILDFLKEGSWPPVQPGATTIAPAPLRAAEEIPVEQNFLKGPRLA